MHNTFKERRVEGEKIKISVALEDTERGIFFK